MKTIGRGWWGAVIALTVSLPVHAIGTLADVQIYDRRDGRILPAIYHEGRYFVVGVPGHEYSVRVRNSSEGRLLAVMSVDGVNVLNGDTASPGQPGYVFDSFFNADISGWRKSLSRTAAFYFTDLGNSYAARTGRPANVGVIGVALYREKPQPVQSYTPRGEKYSSRADAPASVPAPSSAQGAGVADARNEAGSSFNPERSRQLGTGHGRTETSHVRTTEFVRASSEPAETIVIYYDSRANLLAQGVPLEPQRYARPRPDPFPESRRFVPDPN